MIKKIIIVLTLILFVSITTKPVAAHFLATNGNIGAVLHVDPNDDPIAGSQASFFFEFKDKQNKFKAQNCDCTFEIDENGKNIFSQPLFQNNSNPSLSNASVFYTFPQRDVYDVKVIGKPLTPNAFQPFTLGWNFRVDEEANGQIGSSPVTNNVTQHLIFILLMGIILLIVIVYYIINKHKKFTKRREKDEQKEDIGNIY